MYKIAYNSLKYALKTKKDSNYAFICKIKFQNQLNESIKHIFCFVFCYFSNCAKHMQILQILCPIHKYIILDKTLIN